MTFTKQDQDPFTPETQLAVAGAFEIFEGKREELITLTRTGRLLQAGDFLPQMVGIEIQDKPFILHTVNAFGTETCDFCIGELEVFHQAHPDTEVISLTKQSAKEIQDEDAKRAQEGKPPITHKRVTIDQELAIDLGVALAPGEGADKEFWPTALRRTLALIDGQGRIVDIQQPEDQEEIPDFGKIYEEVENLSL